MNLFHDPDAQAGRYLGKLDSLPPLLARAMLSTAFLASASRKLADMNGTAEYFAQLGIPAPQLMTYLVSGTEATCGALLGAGLLTRLAAMPLIPVMVVAILTARRREFHSFSDLTGVFELSYILLLSYLITNGGGKISADNLLHRLSERKSIENRLDRAA